MGERSILMNNASMITLEYSHLPEPNWCAPAISTRFLLTTEIKICTTREWKEACIGDGRKGQPKHHLNKYMACLCSEAH